MANFEKELNFQSANSSDALRFNNEMNFNHS